MTKENNNIITILKDLNERLKNVSVTRVARIYGCKRPTIYFHLDISRAETVNLDSLNKVKSAIEKAEKEKADKIKKQLLSLQTHQP